MLAAVAEEGVQLATAVGPVVVVWQVINPPATQVPGATGAHSSVLASHLTVCEVLCVTFVCVAVTCDVLLLICEVPMLSCELLCRSCEVLWVS